MCAQIMGMKVCSKCDMIISDGIWVGMIYAILRIGVYGDINCYCR